MKCVFTFILFAFLYSNFLLSASNFHNFKLSFTDSKFDADYKFKLSQSFKLSISNLDFHNVSYKTSTIGFGFSKFFNDIIHYNLFLRGGPSSVNKNTFFNFNAAVSVNYNRYSFYSSYNYYNLNKQLHKLKNRIIMDYSKISSFPLKVAFELEFKHKDHKLTHSSMPVIISDIENYTIELGSNLKSNYIISLSYKL